MNQTKILWIIVFISMFAGTVIARTEQVFAHNNNTYWISFVSSPENSSDPLGEVFLMKIDSIGNIVVPPKMVVTTQNATTALQTAPKGNIRLWMDGRENGLVRIEINKTTLKVTKATPIPSTGILSGVTKKENNNFLLLSTHAGFFPNRKAILIAKQISSEGIPNGKTWQISLVQGSINCGEGVSADGRTAFWIPWFPLRSDYLDSLTIQPLNNSGRTSGETIVKLERDEIHCAADVSNATPNGEKFVVWKYNEPAESKDLSQLFLQTVNSENCQPLTEKHVLTEAKGKFGDLSIDPSGHFVIFSERADGKHDALLFQALDITGHPSGSPKVLVKKSLPTGLDILKDTQY